MTPSTATTATEDMPLLAGAGLNNYRFGIEWARTEPRPGQVSHAELAHYRRMIDTPVDLGLTPVIMSQHSTVPQWFAAEGGWMADKALNRFAAYVQAATTILDGVVWVATINEPNMLAMTTMIADAVRSGQMDRWNNPTVAGEAQRKRVAANPPVPDPRYGHRLVEVHRAARDIVRERSSAMVGWSIADSALTPTPGNEEKFQEVRYTREDLYLEGSKGDDFLGVQSCSSQAVDANGIAPHPEHPDNTLVGSTHRPDALGIACTCEALRHLAAAVADGVDVRGHLRWSLSDNHDRGHWDPRFGLVAVDRETFVRTPKPSLARLGRVAASGGDVLPRAHRVPVDVSAS